MAGHKKNKQKSLKLNFLMNALLTSSSFIFPLITFPYASRILLADGNGKINFATSIINYFLMLSSLGLPLYGVRTCAVVRDDRKKLSRTVQELFLINVITTAITLVLLAASIALVPKFQDYEGLLLILSCNIWLRTIGMEWLYQALEEYSYITIRSIAFKIVGILLMFAIVHDHADYELYALTTVIGGSGSLILNFIRAFKIVDRVPLRECNLKQHLKPILSLFLLSAAWSLYANMDTALLGFLSNDTQTGYYGAAIKIKQMLLACISALGTVLLPRLSNYFGTGRQEEFYRLLRKDSSFIMVAGFAIVSFCILDAEEIIRLLSGDAYIPAVPAMRVVMVAIIFSGIYTMLSNNVLIPQKKERIPTYATLVSFVVLVSIDIVLVPRYGAFGSAIGATIGTISGAFLLSLCVRKDLCRMFDISNILKTLVSASGATFGTIIVKYATSSAINNVFILLVIQGLTFLVVYLVVLLIIKEPFITAFVSEQVNKIRHRR